MKSLKTILAKKPYFDNFDFTNNYKKILFKPGLPVQTRELNQLQSIFTHELGSLSDHIFKNGSRVSNCRSSLFLRDYVRLTDVNDLGNVPTDPKFKAKLVGSTSGVEAILSNFHDKIGDYGNDEYEPYTINVVYTKNGTDTEQSKFMHGEEIEVYTDDDLKIATWEVRCPECPGSGLTPEISPTGKSYYYAVDEGIVYYDMMYAHVKQQEILVTKYVKFENNTPVSTDKFKVGLDVTTDIITADEESSLLDNSLGYPNASAEGADRLKINMALTKRSYDFENGDKFIVFARYGINYSPEYVKSDSEYNTLMNEFARRTYETAGNFTVNPFTLQVLNEEKVDKNDTNGYIVGGNTDKLVAIVSPGVGYVYGHRVELTAPVICTFDKARDTIKEEQFATTLNNRNYVKVAFESSDVIINDNNDQSVMSLRDILLYDDVVVGSDVSGQQIGVMKVSDQSYIKDNEYILYIYDMEITLAGKNVKDVKSFKTNDLSIYGNAILDDNACVVYDADTTGNVYKLPVSDVKSLHSVKDQNAGSITVKVRRKLTGTLDGSGKIEWTAASNEYFEGYNPVSTIITVGGVVQQISNNQYNVQNNVLSLDMGSSNANGTVTALVDVTKFNQKEKIKVYKTKTFTTDITPSGLIDSTVMLGVTDGFKLNHVKLVNPTSSGFVPMDITDEYEFNGGQDQLFYREVWIKRIKNRSNIDNNLKLEVSFDYFEHQGTHGYYTIDSYKQILADGIIKFENLPTIPVNGQEVHISECVDFRPDLIKNASGVLEFTYPPVTPVQDSTFVSDVESYVPRADTVQIDTDGIVTIKPGTPSETPVAPEPDVNNMAIYNIYMNAYVYNISDVENVYIDNRRFTMRDIGDIRARLLNLEYYVSLNQLKQETINSDGTKGIDRSRNGFIVDDFKNFYTADINNPDFSASIDRQRGELRPKFDTFNTRLLIDENESVNVNQIGDIVTLPYDEVEELVNPFATKTISINPYLVYNKEGSVLLTPNIDTWADDERLPTVSTTIDSGSKALQELAEFNDLVGVEWGSWKNINRTVQRNSSRVTSLTEEVISTGTNRISTTTTNTVTNTTNTDRRNGISRGITSRTDKYTISDVVKDVRIMPFVRSKVVEFYASNLKPNTRMYVLFDNIDVTKHCRIKRTIPNDLTAPEFLDFGGAPIVTDENGEIVGEFMIPANTFFTGEKVFSLTDNVLSKSEATTTATTKYFSGGVEQSKQTSTLNVVSPVITSRQVSQEQTYTTTTRDVNVSRSVEFTPNPPQPAPPQNPPRPEVDMWTWLGRNRDPIAQAFEISESSFITSIDLYFSSVDLKTSDNIWVQIRTMENGYPTTEVVAHKDINVKSIVNFVSEDSTIPYNVDFNVPIYVDKNKLYCFVVGGHSPDTRLWCCRLGEEVVNIAGKFVEEPPSLNSSFRSLNGTTWNAEQFEFIKYKIYRAKFTQESMNLVVKNDTIGRTNIKTLNPIEVENGTNRVRIYANNHGASVNDKVSISLYDNLPLTIEVTNASPPQIGQTLTTPSGSGKVTFVKSTNRANEYTIKLESVTGNIVLDESYQCDPIVKEFNDFILFANGNKPRQPIQVTQSQGFIRSEIKDGLSFDTISSVPIENFNNEFVVVEVDSVDSFIIEVTGTFITNGRFGDNNVTLYNINKRYDTFNISAEYQSYNSTERFAFTALEPTYNKKDKRDIELGTTQYNDKPSIIASERNELVSLGERGGSAKLEMMFTTQTDRITPVINLESISFTGVTNRVGYTKPDTFNVIPNSDRYISEDKDNGHEAYRYITNKTVLKKSVKDMTIYFDLYKDVNADFDVYVKVGSSDTVDKEHDNWIHIDNIPKSKVSSGINQFLEYELSLRNNYSSYSNDEDFNWFRVKLIGKTTNSSKPPLFRNLRIIAAS